MAGMCVFLADEELVPMVSHSNGSVPEPFDEVSSVYVVDVVIIHDEASFGATGDGFVGTRVVVANIFSAMKDYPASQHV